MQRRAKLPADPRPHFAVLRGLCAFASKQSTLHLVAACLLVIVAASAIADEGSPAEFLTTGRISWSLGPPLVSPVERPEDPCHAIKDPTIVRYNGRWHLFCTIRSKVRSHQIEYLSFADWSEADAARRHVLKLSDGYFCAPQVFYFTPHRKWYLVCQVADPSRKPALQPAFSTSDDLGKPDSWTRPVLLFREHPQNVHRWIDFWVICDQANAHLFFTSLDGKMWRSDTPLENFPHGWSKPQVVLEGDVFEASHTYRLKDRQDGPRYLTIIEAQAGGRRYYKAYTAEQLDDTWQPLAATREQPFAAPANVRHAGQRWTDSISHGELLRAGYDEKLEVDAGNLRLLFQGVSDERRRGKPYGQIPWRLGILRPAGDR